MLSRIIYLEIHHNIVLNVLSIIRRERIGQLIYYVDLLDMSRVKTERQKFITWSQANYFGTWHVRVEVKWSKIRWVGLMLLEAK